MGTTRRIGVITAYIEEDWHSQQVLAAANRFGEAVLIRPEELGVRLTPTGATVVATTHDLDAVDGFVMVRGFGEQGNSDFLVPVYQILARQGRVLVNDIDAVLRALDKFETSYRLLEAGIPTPQVVVAQETALAHSVVAEWGRVVAKPLFGSLGMGIEMLEDTAAGHARVPELLERYGAIYLQEYVPSPGRDIRAFVVGPRVAASIYRVVRPGEWRTNIHQGAHPEVCKLDPALATLAVQTAQVIGLDYTGVDIIEGPDGPTVLEVNGNPLWQGLLQATGRNMADEILAWVMERISQTVGKGGQRVA